MKKVWVIVLKALGIVLGAVVVLLAAVCILLNTGLTEKCVHRFADPMLDCTLDFSDVDISLLKEFPSVRVSVDDLSLTYPHDRFSSFEGAGIGMPGNPGRASAADTLASFSRFSVCANPWGWFSGKVDIGEVLLRNLKLYAKSYNGTTANWDVYIPSAEDPADTVRSEVKLPVFSIGKISLDTSEVVFLSFPDKLAADVSFDNLNLDGDVGIDGGAVEFRGIHAVLNGLAAKGSLDGLSATVRLDADAVVEGVFSEDSRPEVDAVVDNLRADGPGITAGLDCKAADLLGNPELDFDATASACLEKLLSAVPIDMGMDLGGNISLSAGGKLKLSELKDYRFSKTRLNASMTGDCIRVNMPSDTMSVRVFHPEIVITSSSDHLVADVCADSLYYGQGTQMHARVRGMRNEGRIIKVEGADGTMIPRAEFSNSEKSVFLRSGVNRIFLAGMEVEAAVQKHVRVRHGAMPDSLRRGGFRREKPDAADSDVKFSVDSTISRYLRQWEPEGRIAVRRGGVISPMLPLRTRLTGLEAGFDNRTIHLDTLGLRCGSSDLGATGKLRGVMSLLRGRGRMPIGAELDVRSNRINANELLAAFQRGKEYMASSGANLDQTSETDESFVVDSITGQTDKPSGMGAIMLPGNVNARFNLNANHVDWTDLAFDPIQATVNLRNRCLQVTNTLVSSNLGDINLDAFYSTRSRDDISAGVDLSLEKISAEGIIHLLPIVDSLMPALKSFKGDLGLKLSATTALDTSMNVVMPSLEGIMRIKGENLKIDDAGNLRKVTRLLMFRNKNIGEIQNLYVDAIVHDNKAEVFPFILGVDRYQLALQGMQGFDKTMDYHVSILKSPFLLKFGIDMYGTMDNWKIALTRAKYRKGVPVFTTQLDSMQLNISEYIQDVYRSGAEMRLGKFRKNFKRDVSSKIGEGDTPSGSLTAADYMQIDSLDFAVAADEETAALMAEIDALLDETAPNVGALSAEYSKLTGGEDRQRKIAALKSESEKKKKK